METYSMICPASVREIRHVPGVVEEVDQLIETVDVALQLSETPEHYPTNVAVEADIPDCSLYPQVGLP